MAGLVFASGLAALSTLAHALGAGHVVCVDDVYGGSNRFFRHIAPALGMTATFASDVVGALRADTRMVWLETPTNPTLRLFDIAGTCAAVRSRCPGALVVVDNTFLTPCFQRPLALGADAVVHSVTKYLNGHCDVVMGALVTSSTALFERLKYLQNAMGAVPGPFDCYLVLRGLRTLHLRMERHASNAMAIASHLRTHSRIARVLYPGLEDHPDHGLALRQQDGFGGMLAVELRDADGGVASRFVSATRIWTLAESLGGVESLIELPAAMTHAVIPPEERARLGITDGLVRLSVGIEDVRDLIADLEQALLLAYGAQ